MSKVDAILKQGADLDLGALEEVNFDAVEQRNEAKESAKTAEAADLADDADCEGCKI
jgi:hypothetical protein